VTRCRAKATHLDEVALVTLPDVPILLDANIETTEFKKVALRTARATEDHTARMKADVAELGDLQARSPQQGRVDDRAARPLQPGTVHGERDAGIPAQARPLTSHVSVR